MFAIQAWKEILGCGEEDGEAQGKEIRRVAGVIEDVPRDLELLMSDRHEDRRLVKLGHQLG